MICTEPVSLLRQRWRSRLAVRVVRARARRDIALTYFWLRRRYTRMKARQLDVSLPTLRKDGGRYLGTREELIVWEEIIVEG